MERLSVSDLIKQLEPLLRKFEDDEGLIISHAEEEAGCKVGDNYMSVVMKTTVKGSRGNGTSYSNSFMTKYLPIHREITSIFRTADLFQNETYFYDKLLPLLGNFGPICVHADANKIVMEDLRSAGYLVLERRELLDFDHSVATIQTLARLHASSLALKLKDISGFEELVKPLKEVVFSRDSVPSLGVSIDGSVKNAIKHFEAIEPRSEELEAGIRYLKSYDNKVYKEMQDLVEPGKGKYDVLTHGDCWNNNIMFKHDPGWKILDVKFVDFQMTRHISPAIDFHYFVYSSPKCVVIEENYDDLVKAYHSAFVKSLREKSVLQDHLRQLTLDWFKNELKKYANYGLFTSCWITGAILAEDHEVIDMDNFTMKHIEEMKANEVKIVPRVAERLKCVLLNYVRRYI